MSESEKRKPHYEMQGAVGSRVKINGRECDYFAGCSYLGLQNHPALAGAAVETIQRYGLGTATSRGGYGEHPVYLALEAAAARYFDAQRTVYYVSAYLGNTILLQGLQGEYDRVFVDEVSHFSVRDGIRAQDAPSVAFRHLDVDDLAFQLRLHLEAGERPLVISDGVFPISGEIAPAPAYVQVLAEYDGAILCLDDAHATGVIGSKGQGTPEYWWSRTPDAGAGPGDPRRADDDRAERLSGVRVYAAHTLSKALGCHGGLIAGDAGLIEKVRRNSTAWVAHSPSPLPLAAAAVAALDLARGDSPLRGQLWTNVAYARSGLRNLGWPLADTPIPIICLAARPGIDLARLQKELFEQDICVAHVTTYSSTPLGGALRVAIFATHTREQIDRLVEQMRRLI